MEESSGRDSPELGFKGTAFKLESAGGVAGWRPTLHMNLKAQLLQKRRSEAAAIRRIMDVKASPLVLTSFIRAPHNKINNL